MVDSPEVVTGPLPALSHSFTETETEINSIFYKLLLRFQEQFRSN